MRNNRDAIKILYKRQLDKWHNIAVNLFLISMTSQLFFFCLKFLTNQINFNSNCNCVKRISFSLCSKLTSHSPFPWISKYLVNIIYDHRWTLNTSIVHGDVYILKTTFFVLTNIPQLYTEISLHWWIKSGFSKFSRHTGFYRITAKYLIFTRIHIFYFLLVKMWIRNFVHSHLFL